MTEETKRLPINFKEQLAAMAANIQKRVQPPSGDVIQVTQTKEFVFPDGVTSGDPFYAVVVDFIAANMYYSSRFDRNNISPPACFALGEDLVNMIPSVNSPDKQADTCMTCPQNKFGSEGKGKACKNQRVLAVIVVKPGENVTAESPIWLLRLSPTAITPWDSYVTKVARAFDTPPVGVISHIGFDGNSQYPSVRFGQPKPNEFLDVCFPRMKEAHDRLMVEPDVSNWESAPAATPNVKGSRFSRPGK